MSGEDQTRGLKNEVAHGVILGTEKMIADTNSAIAGAAIIFAFLALFLMGKGAAKLYESATKKDAPGKNTPHSPDSFGKPNPNSLFPPSGLPGDSLSQPKLPKPSTKSSPQPAEEEPSVKSPAWTKPKSEAAELKQKPAAKPEPPAEKEDPEQDARSAFHA